MYNDMEYKAVMPGYCMYSVIYLSKFTPIVPSKSFVMDYASWLVLNYNF